MVRKTNPLLDNQAFAWVNSRIFLSGFYGPRCLSSEAHCRITAGIHTMRMQQSQVLWKRSILTNPPVEDPWSTLNSVEIPAMQHRSVHWQPFELSNTGTFQDLVRRDITWPTWVMKAPKPGSPEDKARKWGRNISVPCGLNPQHQIVPVTSIL